MQAFAEALYEGATGEAAILREDRRKVLLRRLQEGAVAVRLLRQAASRDAEPDSDALPIPCLNCQRVVMIPAGQVRAALKTGRDYVTFCTKRCNVIYVAREGARQQERAFEDA